MKTEIKTGDRVKDLSPVESMIRSNADMALDQRNDPVWSEGVTGGEALTLCLDSYFENVQDTILEMGMKPADFAAGAVFEMYRAHVREIAKHLGVKLPGDYR